MNIEQTAARLIVKAILQYIKKNNIHFGLLARNLPSFDLAILYEEFNITSTQQPLLLALVGFAQNDLAEYTQIATTIEQVVEWRNDPNVNLPIVVILNPKKSLEKTHSLELFESFKDADLKQYIFTNGIDNNLEGHQTIWKALNNSRTLQSIPLVAMQVIAFYAALQENISPGDAFPYLGLLRDPEISNFVENPGDLVARLLENRKRIQDLLSLNKQDSRTLARAFESDKMEQHRRTFLHIQAYIQDPKLEYLARLTLNEVKDLFMAPKILPGTNSTKSKAISTVAERRNPLTPDEYVIEQLFSNDSESMQDMEALIQSRISAFKENPDNNEGFAENISDIPPTKIVSSDKELEFSFPLDELKKHPLEALMRLWVQTNHWGGLVYSSPPIDPQMPLTRIFDGTLTLQFKPLQPFKTLDIQDNHPGLEELFVVLDSVVGATEQQGESLGDLLGQFYRQRKELAVYRTLFLYDPVVATVDDQIFKLVADYVRTYDQLASALQSIYQRAADQFHDTIELATAQFLALDVIIIDRLKNEAALLTTLHPLHLWKWVELAQRFKENEEVFNQIEQTAIVEASKNIPTILNTLLLHTKMFQPARPLAETHLVFAGELRNLAVDGTVGIPYYESIARQSVDTDGFDKLEYLIRKFLALYPPSRLGLTLTLINPPTLLPILKALSTLSVNNSSEPILQGARITVYRTDPQTPAYDLWTIADEEILALFRQNPFWTFHVDLIYTDYPQICTQIREKAPYHIVLLCDPSAAVVQPILHTSLEQPNPFVIPLQVAYDSFRDTVQFIQSPANGVFDAYLKVRSDLTGGLRKLTYGVGNKPEIEDQHLKMLAEAGQWLIIIDRNHGTAELSSLGQRIAWFSTESRTLSVHTNDYERWREHLEDHLQSLSIKVDWKLLEQHLPDILTIFPNGLLSTVDDIPIEEYKATHQTIRQNSVEKLLSVITTLYWYRQNNQTAILVSITPDRFQDWFRDEKPPHSREVDYFLALWYQQSKLHIDVIAISPAMDVPPTLSEEDLYLDYIQSFGKTLEGLFDEQADRSLLAPMRREKLREALSEGVFSPSLRNSSQEYQAERTKIKANWTTIINNMFSSYQPLIRLRCIRVALRNIKAPTIDSLGGETYKKEIVTLPGALLQTALEVKSPIQLAFFPNEAISDLDVLEQGSIDETIAENITANADSKGKNGFAAQEMEDAPAEAIEQEAERLRRALISYGIAITSVDVSRTQVGPRVIRYWVKLQPPAGRLAEVQKFAVDLARELSSKSVPIIDNIPGEPYIGIDLARENPQIIPFVPALEELPVAQPDKMLAAIGVNAAGEKIQWDLAGLPHMLIAGSTGSGKTMFLSTLIISLVWRHSPNDLELLLVDPKQTDFVIFEKLSHLRGGKIIYDPLEAIAVLKSLTEEEKQQRTTLLHEAHCPNILEYNRRHPEKRLSWIVIVVDEFADIILTLSRSERNVFERQIGRLAATGRSVGIHLVLATQRPTTDVITGTVKANIRARISFRLPSIVDSRTILDYAGAERLLGQGDMLASIDGEMQRIQGYYAPYGDIEEILNNTGKGVN